MLDSTPLKFAPPEGRNEIMNELMQARLAKFRQSLRAGPDYLKTGAGNVPGGATLDLIAHWDGSLHTLCEAVEMVSDWGPFELADMKAIYTHDGRRVICRFNYHGGAPERTNFESALRSSLKAITRWDDAPSEGLIVSEPVRA